MANNKVRVGAYYYYSPNLLDRVDGRTNITEGEIVQVINLHGCPPANTMAHCYVRHIKGEGAGTVAGLVHVNSLLTRAQYVEYLRLRIAAIEHDRTTE